MSAVAPGIPLTGEAWGHQGHKIDASPVTSTRAPRGTKSQDNAE